MNKLKQTAKTILIFILCSATCFLSIGCGEDLTFEDGEYTAELVAQPGTISSIYLFRDFPVKLKNNELWVDGENCGALSSRKITAKNYDIFPLHTFGDFNISEFMKQNKCLSTSNVNAKNYLLMKYNDKNYLASTMQTNDSFLVSAIWELVS